MSDGSDGARRTDPPVRADGGETPTLGEYVHEPAVEPDEEDDSLSVDGPTADSDGATPPRGDVTPRAADGEVASDATVERGGSATADARARERSATEREPTTDGPDLLARVAESVDDGSVRGTVGGVVGVYGLFGAGLALLSILVGVFAPPVVETTWDPYPLLSEGALLTAIPVVAVALAVLTGVYAAARLGRTDGAVAGGGGAALGAVLASWLTIGGVAVGAGGATIRVDGVLIASVFLAVVVGGVAAGVAVVVDRLGLGAADAPVDPDSTDGGGGSEGTSAGEPAAD